MKHLKIEYCACGNPIFPALPELILEYNFSEILGNYKNKQRKSRKSPVVLCLKCKKKED